MQSALDNLAPVNEYIEYEVVAKRVIPLYATSAQSLSILQTCMGYKYQMQTGADAGLLKGEGILLDCAQCACAIY